MEIDFLQKRPHECRAYFEVSSRTSSPKFYQILGKIVFTNFEKIGEFPKNSPSNISGMVWDSATKPSGLKHIVDAHLQYLFQIFRTRGSGTQAPQILEKNRLGANGRPVAGFPSQKTQNFPTQKFRGKARKSRNWAEIFIFELGWLYCHP